jgi:branched-subunit amino acid transport protein
MTDATIWAVLITCGLLTLLLRAAFIVGWGRLRLPGIAQRALRFVPVAILVALIVPDTLMRDGALALTLDNPRMLAALVATVVAVITRNMLLTIGSGFAALLILTNAVVIPF